MNVEIVENFSWIWRNNIAQITEYIFESRFSTDCVADNCHMLYCCFNSVRNAKDETQNSIIKLVWCKTTW